MKLQFKNGLLYASIKISYKGKTKEVDISIELDIHEWLRDESAL